MMFHGTLDTQIFRLINSGWHPTFLDFSMSLISDFGMFKIPLLVAAVVLWSFGSYRERLLIIMAALVLLIGGEVVAVSKHTLNQPRPYQVLTDVRKVSLSGVKLTGIPQPYERGGSMPSGHVANNVAIAWLVMLIYRRRGWFIWIWVGLMAYSRVYTGSHFPIDTLLAFFIATAYTWIIAFAARKLWYIWIARKAFNRWQIFPALYERYPNLFPDPIKPAGREI